MAKDDQAAEAPAEEGGKKKLIIIIGAVALVVVLAVVAFMLLGKGDKKKAGAEGQAAPAAAEGGHGGAAPAAEGGHGGGAAAGAATVYSLEPFIVNIYDGQDLRYLKVKIELQMTSPTVKTDLDGQLAAIRDAILVVLTTKTLQDVMDVQGKNQLRDDILTAINKIVAQGKVSKVYFTDFVVQ